MLITGLRGVGKTVLLGAFESRARAAGWITVSAEITKNEAFGPRMGSMVRRALFQVAPEGDVDRRRSGARPACSSRSRSPSPPTDRSRAGIDIDPVEGHGRQRQPERRPDRSARRARRGRAGPRHRDRVPARRGAVPPRGRVRSADRGTAPHGAAPAADHARRRGAAAAAAARGRGEVVRRAPVQVPAHREALAAGGRSRARASLRPTSASRSTTARSR